jgi:hypothetical protein
MVKIPTVSPEEMSYEEISEFSEDIKKEEHRRKRREKEYVFTAADIKEMNQRLAAGEELDDITMSISNREVAPPPSIPIPIRPIPKPVPTPIQKVQPLPSELSYLVEREIKKAKKEEHKILRSEEQRIYHPAGECCSNVCETINDEIEQYLGDSSGDKDIRLKFDTLRELRRQFYIKDACQCANGHVAERSDIPLREKQIEDCCPKVCNVLNNAVEGYEGILFPTHNIRIKSETVYDIRSKMFHNNACKCVETEEQLKKPIPGGSPIDPVLQNKLAKLVKYAEKQGWIKDAILIDKYKKQ